MTRTAKPDPSPAASPMPEGVGAATPQSLRATAALALAAPTVPARSEEPTPIAGTPPVWEWVESVVAASEGYRASLTRDAMFRRSLAAADVLAAYASLLIATVLVGGGQPGLRPSIILIAPLIVVACKAMGLYDRDQHILRKTTLDELPSALYISVLYALSLWLTQKFVLVGVLDRPEVFTLLTACFGLMGLGRSAARFTAVRRCPEERCIVLGTATDAHRAASKLSGSPGVRATVVGSVTVEAGRHSTRRGIRDLSHLDSIVGVIAEQRADRVIVATDGLDEDTILDVIRTLKAIGIKVSVLPRLLEVVGSSAEFDEIDGITLLGVRQAGLTTSSKALKRGMDICVSGAALTLLSPLLIVLAAAVKLDTPGPVLFRQTRIGRGGRCFSMYKFRSMVVGADAAKDALRRRNEARGGLFKIADDPRITRVGALLRQLSLDELPQLFNVLVGHMSLVGPRPLVPDEDALIEGWERRRLAVRPGITGLWQIFGSSRIPLPEMVKIDYFYWANWSLWGDTKIILRTVPYVLRRRGF